MLSDPFAPLKRFFSSKGFGVHSPFAFRFIREVLFQPYSYYAYAELDKTMPDSPRTVGKDLKRLYRIILHCSPREVINDSLDSALSHTVALAKSGYVNKNDYRLRIVSPEVCAAAIPEEEIVIWLDSRQSRLSLHRMAEFLDKKGHGMMFLGNHMSVAFNLPSLPRQDFELSI